MSSVARGTWGPQTRHLPSLVEDSGVLGRHAARLQATYPGFSGTNHTGLEASGVAGQVQGHPLPVGAAGQKEGRRGGEARARVDGAPGPARRGGEVGGQRWGSGKARPGERDPKVVPLASRRWAGRGGPRSSRTACESPCCWWQPGKDGGKLGRERCSPEAPREAPGSSRGTGDRES